MRVGPHTSAKSFLPSSASKQRQQVAAVCYRTGKRGIEFLLVQTRSGRWIFPKGGVEPGLSRAHSAALEAFEEAGVHGRMEEVSFARYFRSTPADAERSASNELPVIAFLCEVSWLETPAEKNRTPTWFSAEKAKQRLLERRAAGFGTELGRVVDRALARIRRLHGETRSASDCISSHRGGPERISKDGLQQVLFEASETGHVNGELASVVYARHFLQQSGPPRTAQVIDGRPQTVKSETYVRRLLQLGTSAEIRRPILNEAGSAVCASGQTGRKITLIDSGLRTGSAKKGLRTTNKAEGSLPRSGLKR